MNRRPQGERRRRAQAGERARIVARFVVETLLAEGVHVGVVASPFGPSISTWAPDAPSPELQAACQESFREAMQRNWPTIRRLYADGRRTRGN